MVKELGNLGIKKNLPKDINELLDWGIPENI